MVLNVVRRAGLVVVVRVMGGIMSRDVRRTDGGRGGFVMMVDGSHARTGYERGLGWNCQ